jgi:hypothetical protein
MDIQSISSRPSAGGVSVSTTTSLPAAEPSAIGSAFAALQAATTQDLSSGGMFLSLLNTYASQHPEEVSTFLAGVADKLRAFAQRGDVFSAGLTGWADRFQRAAESGDLSNLVPSVRPAANLGLRAYQVAQQAAQTPAAILSTLPPPNDPLSPSALDSLSQELVELSNASLSALRTLTGQDASTTTATSIAVSTISLLQTTVTSDAVSGGASNLLSSVTAGLGDTLDPTLAGASGYFAPANTNTLLSDLADVDALGGGNGDGATFANLTDPALAARI